jgi:6-phosphogluconolactonase
MTRTLSFAARFGAAAVLLAGTAAAVERPAGKLWVYVGTYTRAGSKGVYRCTFDPANGQLSAAELAAETPNPTFLALHPNGRFLYAANEINNFGGQMAGAVSAFALDPATGKLTALNQQSSSGAGPCHLVVDKPGKHVLVANYGGGSACILAVGDDGRLGDRTDFVQHEGKGTNPQRQDKPHAHSFNLDPAGKFAFLADLGLDRVFVHRYDAAKGTIEPNDPVALETKPGSGPRHFAFHPDGKRAYVLNELASTLTACDYDPARGVLTEKETLSTLPADFRGNNTTAEVVVHPAGKFVYCSNRGHNSLAIFAIEADSSLKLVGHEPTQGRTPRNFNIDPSGAYLIAANQDTNNMFVFRIDGSSGKLTATGPKVDIGAPVCIKFLAAP